MASLVQEKRIGFAWLSGVLWLLVALLLITPARDAAAQSGTWSSTTGGNWSDSANWRLGTIADGSGNSAIFNLNTAAAVAVTLDGNRSIGRMDLIGTSIWTLGGSGTLTLAGGTPGVWSPPSGTATVSAALAGSNWQIRSTGTLGTLVLTNGSNSTGRIDLFNGTLRVADSTVYGAGDQAITTTITGTNGVKLNGSSILQFRYNGQDDSTPQTLSMQGQGAAGSFLAIGSPTIDVGRQGGTGTNKTIAVGTLTFDGVTTLSFTGDHGYSLRIASLVFQANATSVTFNPTSAAVTIAGNVSVFGSNARVLTLGGTAAGNSFSGNIANAVGVMSLTKSNNSSWTLSGSNTYTGSTSVTGGLLEIAPAGRLTATSGITLDGSTAEFRYNSATALARPLTLTRGTLSGTGTINTAVSVGTNAILSPGNSPGTQAFSAGLTWAPGGTYRWELGALTGVAGTTWDLIDITAGTFDLSSLSAVEGGRFTLDLATLGAGGAPEPLANGYDGGTYSFLIADFGGAGFTVPGTFSTAAGSDLTPLFSLNLANWLGPQPDAGNMSVRVNSSGTGIELIIVPEPTALALCGIGAAVILASTRRRQRIGRPMALRQASAERGGS